MFAKLRQLRPKFHRRKTDFSQPTADNGVPSHWSKVTLEDVLNIPGMTIDEELKYFYWCCAKSHRRGNRVVELGPYMGRSTAALVGGLLKSPDAKGTVVTIDRFQWDSYTIKHTLGYTRDALSPFQRDQLSDAELNPKENDSCRRFFDLFMEPIKSSLQVVSVDLATFKWTAEPIDVFMIDAAKSWDVFDQLIREFFPALVDGAAVIHQDYKHAFTYWIHPVTERMLERGVLSIDEIIDRPSTQGFRYHKRADFRTEDYLRSAFSTDEMDTLMARSIERFKGKGGRMALVGARCRMLQDQRLPHRAKAVFEQAVKEGAFADDFFLSELLLVAGKWARPLTSVLLDTAQVRSGDPATEYRLKSAGAKSLSISTEGEPITVDVPALDARGATTLAMSFRSDTVSNEALRIRICASNSISETPFYDEEFRVQPGSYQAVAIPLAGRPSIAMQWMISSEGRSSIPREIHCIAPMFFNEA